MYLELLKILFDIKRKNNVLSEYVIVDCTVYGVSRCGSNNFGTCKRRAIVPINVTIRKINN